MKAFRPSLSLAARLMGLVLLLGIAMPVAALSMKTTYAADVNFSQNSVALPLYHRGLDGLACRTRQNILEVIVVVGHADTAERLPKELSTRRAEAVRDRLVKLGVPSGRIYPEGKGADQTVGVGSVNRRVEVEWVGLPGQSPETCEPGWNQTFLDLSIPGALALSNALIRDGQMTAEAAVLAAIRARKVEYLDAMLQGPHRLPLKHAEGARILREAVVSGEPQFVRRVIEWGVPKRSIQLGLPLVWLACESQGTRMIGSESVDIAEALLAWGAVPQWVRDEHGRETTALQCAAERGALELARLLLRQGADPDLPSSRPPVLVAGRFPKVAAMLIAAGANPRVQFSDGTTLFHIYLVTDAKEVKWLLDLGLDINAATSNGDRPLQSAVYYAKTEVLDAFLQAGARAADGVPKWGWPLQNVDATVWLIDQGTAWPDLSSFFQSARLYGDKILPVFHALARRGLNFGDRSKVPSSLLDDAAFGLAPQLVEWLLLKGAISSGAEAHALRLRVMQDPLRRIPSTMYPSKEDIEALNTPAQMEERERRRQRIVELLAAYE